MVTDFISLTFISLPLKNEELVIWGIAILGLAGFVIDALSDLPPRAERKRLRANKKINRLVSEEQFLEQLISNLEEKHHTTEVTGDRIKLIKIDPEEISSLGYSCSEVEIPYKWFREGQTVDEIADSLIRLKWPHGTPKNRKHLTDEEAERVLDREYYIGGSDVPVIMGLSPFKKRWQLLVEKRNPEKIYQPITWQMEYGNDMKEEIREYVNEVTDLGFRPETKRSGS